MEIFDTYSQEIKDLAKNHKKSNINYPPLRVHLSLNEYINRGGDILNLDFNTNIVYGCFPMKFENQRVINIIKYGDYWVLSFDINGNVIDYFAKSLRFIEGDFIVEIKK